LIESNRNKITLPLAMSKQRLEFEKLKAQRTQSEEKLNKLLADREAMTVKAPCDGIVYYGKCTRGKWTTGTTGDTLRRGATIMPNDAFMTVVQPRPLAIRVTVPESQVQNIRPGVQAVVEPNGLSGTKLPAMVNRVAAVPLAAGGFDGQLTLALDGQADALMPGMNCEVKMVPYKKTDALTIPPKALFTEEMDPARQFVYVVGKGDKPEKRTVKVGRRNEKQVEILQGLAEGDHVLTEKPKE
jgi:HlyD family secretion protein